MKVQTKLIYWNTALFSGVFILIGILFLFTYYHFGKQSILKQLRHSANISAIFHLEEDELSAKEFTLVKREFQESVQNPYYQVYDESNSIRYGFEMDTVSNEVLDLIRKRYAYAFSDDNYYSYGIFYHDNEGDFVVIAREKKNILTGQLKMLAILLLISLIVSTIATTIFSKFIAYKAFKPFRDINKAALNLIENRREDLALLSPNTNDELEELINILNKLLNQLEETFKIQNNFVRYVTHEFKTPLASINGHLEVFSIKDRSPEEYRALTNRLISEVRGLNKILDTLLAISDIHQNREIKKQYNICRLDEIIWNIIESVKFSYSNANLEFNIDLSDSIRENIPSLEIEIDDTQITMALSNLIENAIKYSNGKKVYITITPKEDLLILTIKDDGIGIPKSQIPHLSQPFYRAENVSLKSGSGIGLSIALRILEKNNIPYQIDSEINEGTKVTITFG